MRKNDPTQPKACTKCHREKQPGEFGRTRFGTLTSWCKRCTADKSLEIWHKYKPAKVSTRISGQGETERNG